MGKDIQRFIYYKSLEDRTFYEENYKKKEFYLYRQKLSQLKPHELEELGDMIEYDKPYVLLPQQEFLRNYISPETPYKSALIFHGVGVGKTCSAITIAESFRDVFSRKDKRSIILSSKNIQIGWKKTIFNPGLKEEQCTGKVFLNRNIKTKRELTRLVKEYYEL